MGLLCDYFVAPTDDDAAGTVDLVGGPGAAVAAAPDPRGLLYRTGRPATTATDPAFPTVPGNGVEPVVQMGTLEALLTGRTFDEVLESARRDPVALRDGGERLVLRLNDPLADALATASDDRLAEVAGPWSRTDEFWGDADPATLASFLLDLAALARGGRERGEALYCWVSV